jgi:hydroxylysine kinase
MQSSQSTLEKISASVDHGEVQNLLLHHYGLRGKLIAITGERDHNFVLHNHDGQKYIVKVAHEDEDFANLDFQSRVVATIFQNAPELPLSIEIQNHDQQKITTAQFADGMPRFMRVNSFMPGLPLCDVPRTPATRKAIGALTAKLALALKGFSHPAEHRILLWDIQQAENLTQHVLTLPPDKRALATYFHDKYCAEIAPQPEAFRAGVIHNDLNLHNLFVDGNNHAQITGCIDFGDMVRAPLINDLAIAAAYQMDAENNPLQSLAETAKAYHAINPLLPKEVDYFMNLVAMRFVLTVAITHWRAKLHPENAKYILRNAPAAWAGLAALRQIPITDAREYLHEYLAINPAKS